VPILIREEGAAVGTTDGTLVKELLMGQLLLIH
jgi:hypothetical protein